MRSLTLGLVSVALLRRRGWVRGLLIAFAAMLTMIVLLGVFAVPMLAEGESRRADLQRATLVEGTRQADSVGYIGPLYNSFGTHRIDRVVLGDPQGNAPLPPGVPRLPGAGEVFLSPELARLMLSEPTVGAWFPQDVAGEIGPEGLVTPDQLLAYVGAPADGFPGGEFNRAIAFGTGPTYVQPHAGAIRWFQVAGFSMLVVIPALTAFVASIHTGAAHRRRRSRALSVVGVSTRTVTTVSVAETVIPAVIGSVLGAALFAVLAPEVDVIPVVDRAITSSDIRVEPRTAGLIVLTLTVLAGTISAHSAAKATRIGHSNRPSIPRPRIGRLPLLALAAGFALITASIVNAHPRDSALRLGLILTAIGIPTASMMLTQLLGRAARSNWPLAVLIGLRRLRRDAGASGAMVAVVSVMTFSLGSVIPFTYDHGSSTSWNSLRGSTWVGDTILVRGWSISTHLPLTLPEDGQGLAPVAPIWPQGSTGDAAPSGTALIATCEDLATLVGAPIADCSDATPNLVASREGNPATTAFELRTTDGQSLSVPEGTSMVSIPGGNAVPIDTAVVIAPSLLPSDASGRIVVTALYARITSEPPDIERFRATAIGSGPGVVVDIPGYEQVQANTLNQWILLGILLAAALSVFTILTLALPRPAHDPRKALAIVGAPPRIATTASVIATTLSALAGSAVAVTCGLAAAWAYTRGAETPFPPLTDYLTLGAASTVAGAVLGWLGTLVSRVRI